MAASGGGVAGAIGNYAGGIGGVTTAIDTINISSLGDATDHGNLDVVSSSKGSCDSGTNGRGLLGGTSSSVNQIDYWTIDSKGDASDFGELSISRWYVAALSNATNNRGIFGGGDAGAPYPVPGYSGTMDYVNISSPATAVDFGDLASAQRTQTSGLDNGTNDRGLWMGGWTPATESDGITYVTITSLSNAQTFGDLQEETYSSMSVSNATGERGVTAGGSAGDPGVVSDKIDVITITSLGDATDHGNLSSSRSMGSEGADNGVDDRGTFGGSAADSDVIDYIAITGTTGASDFGDLTASTSSRTSGCSNGAT